MEKAGHKADWEQLMVVIANLMLASSQALIQLGVLIVNSSVLLSSVTVCRQGKKGMGYVTSLDHNPEVAEQVLTRSLTLKS